MDDITRQHRKALMRDVHVKLSTAHWSMENIIRSARKSLTYTLKHDERALLLLEQANGKANDVKFETAHYLTYKM